MIKTLCVGNNYIVMQTNLLSQSIADFFISDTFLPVILCIGSDKVTGDALGPIVGELLTSKFDIPCFVYGTLSSTVTALNVQKTLSYIRRRHPNRKIIAVDSGLGDENAVGKVKCYAGGIKPGQGVGKNLQVVGDFSVLGVVDNKRNAHLLSSLSLGRIYRLAQEVALTISGGIENLIASKLSSSPPFTV